MPQSVLATLRMICFWGAVTLPFLYLPLLAFGLQTRSEIGAFAVLVAVNGIALVVGHEYNG
jgi:hypothetical protein